MAVQLSDADILRLLAERKALSANFRQLLQPKPKRGHSEHEMSIKGIAGSRFRLLIRQSLFNPLDFSVILGYLPENVSGLFRLRRYNGKSHEHTNKIEGSRFYEFHIHTATERYQDRGMDEDGFAEPTSRFSDLNGAIDCMVADCGFDLPPEPQMGLRFTRED
jgi:hypothetical protein